MSYEPKAVWLARLRVYILSEGGAHLLKGHGTLRERPCTTQKYQQQGTRSIGFNRSNWYSDIPIGQKPESRTSHPIELHRPIGTACELFAISSRADPTQGIVYRFHQKYRQSVEISRVESNQATGSTPGGGLPSSLRISWEPLFPVRIAKVDIWVSPDINLARRSSILSSQLFIL